MSTLSSIPQKSYQALSELTLIQTSQRKYQNPIRPSYQERIWLNDYQHQLYRTAMKGLRAFTKAELYRMSAKTKSKIRKFYEKAQIILNRWKQQLVNEMFEQLCSIDCVKFSYNPFQKVFNETTIGVKKFGKTIDDKFRCTLSFAQLKISREQVIFKLIQEQVLPTNFYKLQKI